VEDLLRAPLPGQGRHRLPVANVGGDQLGAPGERRVEVLAPPGGEVIDHDHLVPAAQQRVGQIRADEAGPACHKCLHRWHSVPS
jgi:hypothetical protein